MQEVFDRRPEAIDMPILLAGNKIDLTKKVFHCDRCQPINVLTND